MIPDLCPGSPGGLGGRLAKPQRLQTPPLGPTSNIRDLGDGAEAFFVCLDTARPSSPQGRAVSYLER